MLTVGGWHLNMHVIDLRGDHKADVCEHRTLPDLGM